MPIIVGQNPKGDPVIHSAIPIEIRPADSQDLPVLRKMLYEAIYIPPEEPKPDESIVDDPQIIKYIQDWKQHSDCGCIAHLGGTAIGAAWSRLFPPHNPGYGFVAPHIPELCMAIHPQYRNQGIGTLLLQHLFLELRTNGFSHLSLSVDQRNRAAKLYVRTGFSIVETKDMDYVMVRELFTEN
jgi:ribosomal protein S18 acetylase RimI-like enzyme